MSARGPFDLTGVPKWKILAAKAALRDRCGGIDPQTITREQMAELLQFTADLIHGLSTTAPPLPKPEMPS